VRPIVQLGAVTPAFGEIFFDEVTSCPHDSSAPPQRRLARRHYSRAIKPAWMSLCCADPARFPLAAADRLVQLVERQRLPPIRHRVLLTLIKAQAYRLSVPSGTVTRLAAVASWRWIVR